MQLPCSVGVEIVKTDTSKAQLEGIKIDLLAEGKTFHGILSDETYSIEEMDVENWQDPDKNEEICLVIFPNDENLTTIKDGVQVVIS